MHANHQEAFDAIENIITRALTHGIDDLTSTERAQLADYLRDYHPTISETALDHFEHDLSALGQEARFRIDDALATDHGRFGAPIADLDEPELDEGPQQDEGRADDFSAVEDVALAIIKGTKTTTDDRDALADYLRDYRPDLGEGPALALSSGAPRALREELAPALRDEIAAYGHLSKADLAAFDATPAVTTEAIEAEGRAAKAPELTRPV